MEERYLLAAARYIEMNPTVFDVEFDHVSLLDQGQRPAYSRFWCYMEYHGAECCATHASIRDAYHIRDPLFQKFLG